MMNDLKLRKQELKEQETIELLSRMSLSSIENLTRLRKRKLISILAKRKRELFNTLVATIRIGEADIFCSEQAYLFNKESSIVPSQTEVDEVLAFFSTLSDKLNQLHKQEANRGQPTIILADEYKDFLKADKEPSQSVAERLRAITASGTQVDEISASDRDDLLFKWIRENLFYMQMTSMRAMWLMFNKKVPSCRVSYSFFRGLMMHFYGFKYGKITIRSKYLNTDECLWTKLNLFLKMQKVISEEYTIVFLDESYFRRVHSRAKNWCSAVFEETDTKYMSIVRDTVTLTLAVTSTGFIFTKFREQTNDANSFIEFLTELSDSLRKAGIDKFFFFMDNVSLHRTTKVLSYLQKNSLNAIYSVKYCCEYNLCEYVFSPLDVL